MIVVAESAVILVQVKLLLSIFYVTLFRSNVVIQPAFTCSNLTIETLEQGVKYVQSLYC